MARQTKIGLDYFSHDVDITQDKKVKLLRAKYGLVGYAIYMRLLEELYREDGYYLRIDEDFNILFASDNNIDIDVYISILDVCINTNLFDINVYKKYNVLTSERTQINYLSAASRRKSIVMCKQFLLVNLKDANINSQNVNIIPLDVNINQQNVDDGTQSKVKETKVNNKVNKKYYACEDLIYFNNLEFQETWIAWMDVRKKKKAVLTEYSMKRIYDKLMKWAPDNMEKAIEIIDKSILGNYPNIYEPQKSFPPFNNNSNKFKGEQNFDF